MKKPLQRVSEVSSPLTPQLELQILTMLRMGLPRHRVPAAVGVDPTTFDDWLAKGKTPDAEEPYLGFATEFERVEASLLATTTATIVRAAQIDWKAADRLIELRFPHDAGKDADPTRAAPPPPRGEDLEDLREVLKSPEEYGLEEILAENYVSRGEADKLRAEISRLKKTKTAKKKTAKKRARKKK